MYLFNFLYREFKRYVAYPILLCIDRNFVNYFCLDFSGRVDIPDRHGYRAEPSDYEVSVVDREPETLLQRFQRLKGEVAELASDVEKVKESQQSSEKLLQVSPADLLQDVSPTRRNNTTTISGASIQYINGYFTRICSNSWDLEICHFV